MVYVRSRKFCCCLPVRFGVFVMTLVGTIGGGLVAGELWKQINDNDTFEKGTLSDKISAGVNAGIWTLLAVVSLFGFIGTVAKRRGLVALYSTLLFINLALSIASGSYYLYTLFHGNAKQNAINKCESGSTSDVKGDACKAGFDVLRIVLIAVFCVVWIILLYGCVIVSNYVGQLHEEEALEMPYYARSDPNTLASHPMRSMPMVGAYDPAYEVYQESKPLAAHDHNEYAYRAPQHAFGSR
ncbi:hypothetical protein DFH11DRAFT_1731087 [Phellopilus nigrolimitatus]|nr:hypothetical protein DFH11DRAFT_1731087 [Phellopilus nigrolimitatus]